MKLSSNILTTKYGKLHLFALLYYLGSKLFKWSYKNCYAGITFTNLNPACSALIIVVTRVWNILRWKKFSRKCNLTCLCSMTLCSTCTCTVKCLIHNVIMHAGTQYIPQSGLLSWVQHFLLVWQMRCVHRHLPWHTLSHWKWSRNAAPRDPFVLLLDVDQSCKKTMRHIHSTWKLQFMEQNNFCIA